MRITIINEQTAAVTKSKEEIKKNNTKMLLYVLIRRRREQKLAGVGRPTADRRHGGLTSSIFFF